MATGYAYYRMLQYRMQLQTKSTMKLQTNSHYFQKQHDTF